jgi:peptidoglycan/xylan/chitin deacetylase (PgdA/CDA1 family)
VATIVMYHYVRDLRRTRFPAIRGLDIARFRAQLAHLRRYYTIITAEEFMAAVSERQNGSSWPLPRNAMLLTFDDGYADHYRYVLPILADAGLQGAFFVPAQPVLERVVLDVNKIQFVLASVADPDRLIAETMREVNAWRRTYDLDDTEMLYQRFAKPSRFDPPPVVFLKRVLQKGLPAPVRSRIVDALFTRHVTRDQGAFAEELYMTEDQVRHLVRAGMYVGGHTVTHPWLSELAPDEQASEIDGSIAFLRAIGIDTHRWMMAYPYGDVTASAVATLAARGCAAGLTIRVGIASTRDDALLLPRLNTNDLPVETHAPPSEWTARVLTV